MTFQEIKDKQQKMKSEGKSDKEISELLKDDIAAFAKECYEDHSKMDSFVKQMESDMKSNSIMNTFLFGLLSDKYNGWGR